jgi:hypothetical protein
LLLGVNRNCLLAAVMMKHTDIVKVLVEAGGQDVMMQTLNDNTSCLLMAAQVMQTACVCLHIDLRRRRRGGGGGEAAYDMSCVFFYRMERLQCLS